MPTILLPLIGPRMDIAGVSTPCLQLLHTSGLTRTIPWNNFFLVQVSHSKCVQRKPCSGLIAMLFFTGNLMVLIHYV